MQYYIVYNGQTIGPMAKEQLLAYHVDQNTMVSDGGDWRPLYTFPELMEVLGTRSANSTNKTLCGVLALLVGWLGLHYFIIGKTAGGIINIVLCLVTCGIWTIIDFIQGIMILVMSDQEWERKFVNSPSTFPIF